MRQLFLYTLVSFLLVAAIGCKSSENTTSTKGKKGKLSEREEIALKKAFMNGSKEKILGNLDLAINFFEKCIKIDPNNAAALYELASIYEYNGYDALAMEYSKKASEIDPENEWYQVLLAEMYLKLGKFEEGGKVYEQLVQTKPKKFEYYFEWANAKIYEGKFRDAIDIYNKVEEKMGVSEDLTKQKQRILVKLGDIDGAITELQKLIKENPNEPNYYGMLAELYQANGNEEKTLETLEKLKEIDPGNPKTHLTLSEYYRKKEQPEKAFAEMKKAFSSEQLDIDTKMQVLLSYYTRSETDSSLKRDAYELVDTLVKVHPDDPKSHSIKGDYLYRDVKLKEARSAYKKAVELDESKFPIWSQIVLIDAEMDDYPAMVEDCEKAIELFPSQPSFYYFKGLGHYQQKQYEEAKEYLTLGKDLVIGNPQLLLQMYSSLGDVENDLGNYAESDIAFEEALTIDPNNTYVLNNYAYYLSLRKENLEKAATMSKKTNELQPGQPSFLDTYAWILFQQEKYEEAKEWMKKAVDKGGKNSGVILEHYGDVLIKLGEKEEAMKYWNMAKEKSDHSKVLDKKIANQQYYEE